MDNSTKRTILHKLIHARLTGEHLSGSALASELGISRNSVWKAINALKAEGYEIVSEQSRGYYLATHTDVLSYDAIKARLADDSIELIVLDSIDSTNDYAKSLAYDGPETAITADEQTGGRGRYGRAFSSPKGTGIYLTYSFSPKFPLSEVTKVTTITACVVHRVLSHYAEGLGIKWINDIYRDGLKICGILTEGVGSIEANFERIIVGIGINVFPANFPEELRGIAGSLTESSDAEFSRNEIITEIVNGLHDALANATTLSQEAFLDYYRANCFVIGRDITIHQAGREPRPARATGINDSYELIADAAGERVVLSSGEVSIRM